MTNTTAPATSPKSLLRSGLGLAIGAVVAASMFLSAFAPPASASAGVNFSTIRIGDARVCEGATGTRSMRFTVSLDAPATSPVSVSFLTANSSAQAPFDYTAQTGSLSFSTGMRSRTFSVAVNGDAANEPNETFNVVLSGASGGTMADSVGVGTIVDEDPTPLVSIGDTQLLEPDSGTATMTFRASLDCNTTQNVTVNWTTVGISATAGVDYVSASGTAIILAGATLSAPITVQLRGDLTVEANEILQVRLSAAAGAAISDGVANGLILNDD